MVVYSLMWLSGMVFCFLGLMMMFFRVKNLLSVLVCLEVVMFGVLLSSYSVCLLYAVDSLFCLLLLAVVVCEGAIGLGLLVLMSRIHGSDYVGLLNSHL